MIRRGSAVKEREPGRDVLRNVGNESKKKQRAREEKDQGIDFIPGMSLSAAGHGECKVIATPAVSIAECAIR